MARMQTDQRVVRGAKEVGADSQPIVIDQLMPFEPSAAEKDRAQNHGERPPQAEGPHRAFLQGAFRYPDCEAARQQTYRVKDGKLQNLARLRPGEAPAYVVDIGDHKNSEDRALSNDERRHGDGAMIGQHPVFVGCSVSQGDRAGAHLYSSTVKIIRTGSPDLPGASGPTTV